MRINNYHKRVLEVSFDGSVKRIEVEKVIDDSADEPWPKFYRTIRVTTHGGEVLVVDCDSDSPEDLELVEVDELGPVPPVPSDNSDWLTPRVAKGKSPARKK